MAVRPVPEGFHTITPYLVVTDAGKLIEFTKAAFGAVERDRMQGPDGRVMHAEVKIGDSILMMGSPEKPGSETKTMICLYVEDCDKLFQQAVAAGGTVERPLETQFYGDRSGSVKDPFGNSWFISTHVEDVSDEEMKRRYEEMSKKK